MDNNTYKTTRARQIKLEDASIDTLKLTTLLAQIKHVLMLTVNVENPKD